MSGRWRAVAWGGALMPLVLQGCALAQRPALAIPDITSWVVYWDPEASLQTLDAQAVGLEEVAVFAYHFDASCRLVPATARVPETVRTLTARAEGPTRPRVLVTVVNDVVTASGGRRLKDPHCVHDVLASPEATAAHLDQLLQVASQADGIELDYENLLAQDRTGFSQLVQSLAAHLHAYGKRLSVVVQPKIDDRIRDGAGALDWSAIAQHADHLKLMAYHYHHARARPGPVAPPAWVETLTQFALTQVPKEKLCVVLTLYGFDWGQGREGRAIGYEEAMRLATAHRAVKRRDPQTSSLHFQYKADGTRHEVWFEDAVSLRRKITGLRRAGVLSIGLWHLGAGVRLIGETILATHEPR